MDDDTPFLPEDIITNILIRLHVKSLIRFQCVCKHWKNLLKSPSFIKDHLHHSSHLNPSLLLPWRPLGSEDWHFDSLDCDMQLHEFQNAPYSSEIISSSNGLICLNNVNFNGSRKSYSFSLWNPATRELRLVLEIDVNPGCLPLFGFISVVNDYKIVTIYQDTANMVSGVNRVELYSLSTGLWKEVECGNLEGVWICSNAVATNGAMFWLGVQGDAVYEPDRYDWIVSFEVAKEVFTLLPIPAIYIESPSLTLYENKLAVLSSKMTGNYEYCIKLWVMGEGTASSWERWNWTTTWTKKHTSIPCIGLCPMTIWMNTVVCIPEYEVMNDKTKGLYLFNITTNECSWVAGSNYCIENFVNYVECLTSVDNI